MILLLFTIVATDFIVAPAGGDFTSIQAALDVAQAGDRVFVEDGTYQEQIVFPRSGNLADGPIQLRAMAGHEPILDGSGFVGGNMVLIEDLSHIVLAGFEIANLSQVNDGSGIRILGSGDNLVLMDNEIHHILGDDAMGITVYGTAPTAITNLQIVGNWIHDCEPARSEALTLNGNIDGFLVADNRVADVNNIGIDFIGGETSINPDPALVARNGICRGNLVERARSNYGGGYGAGIYVDGGRDIVLQGNEVSECDLGIEIGAENAGTDAVRITVRSNWIHHNDKAGLVFGGYDASVGRVRDSLFLNNTCYFNDTLGEGLGQLWIQFASDNRVENNIFFGQAGTALTYSEAGNVNNSLDFNFWYSAANPEWVWQTTLHTSFAAFQSNSGQDGSGRFQNPQLVDPGLGDGHLHDGSPAIDAGDPASLPAETGELDFDGEIRFFGAIDAGMDEVGGLPPCLPSLFASWGEPTSLCGEPNWRVTNYILLVNQTCACPIE